MAKFEPELLKSIDIEFTKKSHVFVFPENFYRQKRNNKLFDYLSSRTNGFGFLVTEKPQGYPEGFYSKEEYIPIFETYLHIVKLTVGVAKNKNKNVFIFEMNHDPILWADLIKPRFEKEFQNDENVIFLWPK